MRVARTIALWGPVVAFMVVIYAISSPAQVPPTPAGWDKLAHVAAYGLFGVLSLRAFHGGLRPLRPLPAVLATLLTLGYALFDELHQRRIPGREASVADWLADAAGAGLAILLVGRLARRGHDRPSTETMRSR